jgi:hypothetical protein
MKIFVIDNVPNFSNEGNCFIVFCQHVHDISVHLCSSITCVMRTECICFFCVLSLCT